MKISYNWLKDYIAMKHDPQELSKKLTDCGLEVEAVEEWQSVKGGLAGLVVGEVIDCIRHPNADKLSICKVDTGGNISQIVCGAPNVAKGQKVIVALPGTLLFPSSGDSFEIKKSKIRGEISEGMICAEDEIGLGASHDGILVLDEKAHAGMPAAEYFSVASDHVFEIGLTPNRADAASHIGVARDIKALYSLDAPVSIALPDVTGFIAVPDKCPIDVSVKDTEGCIRYSGIYIKNIKVGESPLWLRNRLNAVGIRSINSVVDVTNYVMLESGQPLHAFDAEKIRGSRIIVGQLPAGSVFRTLDGVDRKLSGRELMICDAEGGICIAGVFGGLDSGVSEATSSIFLESACFAPASVRKTAKHHMLHTDSSFRFERGTDPEGTVNALKRAALLLKEVAGGKVASEIIDIYNAPVQHFAVQLRFDYLNKLSGIVFPRKTVTGILRSLDITVKNETEEYLDLLIPPFKVDVTRPADVVEEVMRIYGYNKIPLPAKISTSLPSFGSRERTEYTDTLSSYLVAAGFNEIVNNSLTKSEYRMPDGESVEILNPLSSDLSVLRDSMLMPGLETILYNINRQQEHLQLFEFGKTYRKKGNGFREQSFISLWLAGRRQKENWQKENKEFSIYYLKSIISNMLSACGINAKLQSKELADERFEYIITLELDNREIARLGAVSRKLLKEMDIQAPVFYSEADLDRIMEVGGRSVVAIREPNRFPEVRRDLSMVLDASARFEQVEELAFRTDSQILRSVNLFDIYEGEKIGAGRKSYALSFTLYNENATLQEKQIEQVMEKLMKNFEKHLGAVIRKQ